MRGLYYVLDLGFFPGQSSTAFVEQITVLSCGGAWVQFIIRVIAAPVVTASLAFPGNEYEQFCKCLAGV